MPLQIRRGLEAERTQITPTNGLVEGELLYVTDEKKLYIGSGSSGEHQGVIITGYTNNNAKDAAAAIFADGEHTGITFTYDSGTKALNAVVDVSAISGPLVADALQGSVFADDSSLLVDAIDKRFFGNLTGNVLGNLAGNVIGNVTGDVTGNLTGNVTGNLTGNVVGDVSGSVFADNSTMLVDGTNGRIVAPVFGNIFTNLIDSEDSSAIVVATNMIFTSDINVENEIKSNNIINTDEIITSRLVSSNLVSSNINCLRIANPTSQFLELGIDSNNAYTENTVRINKSLGVAFAINCSIDTNEVADIRYIKTRGTFQSRLAVQSGDKTLEMSSGAFDGTAIREVGAISFQTDSGTATGGQYPGKFKVIVGNNSGSTVECSFDSNGIFTINDILKLTLLSAAPSTPTAGMIAIADRTNWDPASKGSGPSYPVYYNGTSWDSLT